jgi:hypothetical protein
MPDLFSAREYPGIRILTTGMLLAFGISRHDSGNSHSRRCSDERRVKDGASEPIAENGNT